MNKVKIKNFKIGDNQDLILIAGPCVIEEKDICFKIATELKKLTQKLNFPFIFKASFDKANRTSIDSFRGPGLEKGLEILKDIKRQLNIPVLTDVHRVSQVLKVSEVVDILQIPAFLCRQTDLILETASTGKIINIKKGQFLAPWDIEHVIKKAESKNNHNILITERGSCFGYNNLVVDMTAISIMKKLGYPVIFDATHSVQKPGGAGSISSGKREFVPALCNAAVSVGCNGLYAEVHINPDKALSDGSNMVNVDMLENILIDVKKIHSVLNRGKNDE